MGGFDLTSFGVRPQPIQQVRPVEPVAPTPVQQPIQQDPNAPKTMDEALRTPLHGEAGFQDRLAKGDPQLKHELWGIDKFVEPGGLPKDKNGNILIKAPPSTEEDRKEVNIS